MGYRTLRACLDDLAATGQLVRIEEEIDPHLEAAEIQRRVYAAGGPAVYYARVKDCRFPMVSNLFGTLERLRYIFRDTLAAVQKLVELKVDPTRCIRRPLHYAGALRAAWHMRPRRVRRAAVLRNETTIDLLPRLVCWPADGGPFITLPQVYTEDAVHPGWRQSNLGMYRIQLSGNQYRTNQEVGLHYQIHRGIGVHHEAAIRAGIPLRVVVMVGGPPALAVAAVMPLPEGLPEISFAGALAGRRAPLYYPTGELPIHADADFCITGTVDPHRRLPEGPFGDHLGYYSLAHDFPVLRVEKVHHRSGAIWPFTVVGRPPQEDTTFGQFIHELTGPVVPTLIPGVDAVHAVDAAGVHPLLLAIGSERYVPYEAVRQPRELLTQANAILGQGQMSLAKYLLIAARERATRSGRARRAGVFSSRAGAGRLAARPALSDLYDDRHAGLLRHGAERRFEAGDRGRRSAAAPLAQRAAAQAAIATRLWPTARRAARRAGDRRAAVPQHRRQRRPRRRCIGDRHGRRTIFAGGTGRTTTSTNSRCW